MIKIKSCPDGQYKLNSKYCYNFDNSLNFYEGNKVFMKVNSSLKFYSPNSSIEVPIKYTGIIQQANSVEKTNSTMTQHINNDLFNGNFNTRTYNIINVPTSNSDFKYFNNKLEVEKNSMMVSWNINIEPLQNLNKIEYIKEFEIGQEYTLSDFKAFTQVKSITLEYMQINSLILDNITQVNFNSKIKSQSNNNVLRLIYTLDIDDDIKHAIILASSIGSAHLICLNKFCSNKILDLDTEFWILAFSIFIGIFVGLASVKISEWTSISMSLLLLLIGTLLGTTIYSEMSIGLLSPRIILWLLLPPLLFESAANVDFHVFMKLFPQILLLAGPGVLFCSFLTGTILLQFGYPEYFNLGSDTLTNLLGCVILGSILSATDPVSVIVLFKQLGTEKKISVLIEGESLLNDGSAVALLEILIVVIIPLLGTDTGTSSNLELAIDGIKLALGGPVVGYLWAVTIKSMLVYLQEPMMQAIWSLTNIYALFFVSEHFMHCSGVLAICAYGLYFSAQANIYMSKEGKHTLHTLTESVAFVSETSIFLISGVIIGEYMYTNSFIDLTSQLLYLGLLYVILHFSRALMLIIFYPVLVYTGYSFDWKRYILLNWSALRGAVGLCGALIVAGELEFPFIYKREVLFYTCGIVVTTTFINGSTCGKIMSIIGLTDLKVNQVEDILECSYQINAICLKFLNNKDVPTLSKLLCTKIEIYNYIRSDLQEAKHEISKWTPKYDQEIEDSLSPDLVDETIIEDLKMMNSMIQNDSQLLLNILRLTYYKSIKCQYYIEFDAFVLSRENFKILLTSVNIAIDAVDSKEPESDVSVILDYVKRKLQQSCFNTSSNINTLTFLNMQILEIYKKAQRAALHSVLREYIENNRLLICDDLKTLLDDAHINHKDFDGEAQINIINLYKELPQLKKLVTESRDNIDSVDKFIRKNNISDQYNFSEAYNASIVLLNEIEKKLHQLNKDGILDEIKMSKYIDKIHQKRYQLFESMNQLTSEEIENLFIEKICYSLTGQQSIHPEVKQTMYRMLSDTEIEQNQENSNFIRLNTQVRELNKINIEANSSIELSGVYIMLIGSINIEINKTIIEITNSQEFRIVIVEGNRISAINNTTLYKIDFEYIIGMYNIAQESEKQLYQNVLEMYFCDYVYRQFESKEEKMVELFKQFEYEYNCQYFMEKIKHHLKEDILYMTILDENSKLEYEDDYYYYIVGNAHLCSMVEANKKIRVKQTKAMFMNSNKFGWIQSANDQKALVLYGDINIFKFKQSNISPSRLKTRKSIKSLVDADQLSHLFNKRVMKRVLHKGKDQRNSLI